MGMPAVQRWSGGTDVIQWTIRAESVKRKFWCGSDILDLDTETRIIVQ